MQGACCKLPRMEAKPFAGLLAPLAALVFVAGWVLAVAAFFVIGTETCAQVNLGIAGRVEVCQDTTSSAVILLTVIGFAASVGSLFLLALRYVILAMAGIEENTRNRPG
jgi:hypothetical protein